MSNPPGRSVVKLRLNYDREDVTVDELRSPQAATLLEDPRPPDVDRKPAVLDEHPEQYDTETVAWDLPPDDRVAFVLEDDSVRELKVENIVCLFPDEEYPDTSHESDTEPTGTWGGDGAADPDTSSESTVAAGQHEFTLTVRETREVRVTHDQFTGYQKHPKTREVVEYEEGPIWCSCGKVFTATERFREHVMAVSGSTDADVSYAAPGPFNNSLAYYDDDELDGEETTGASESGGDESGESV